MAFIPDEELEKVRRAVDIVQVIGERLPLKKAGRNFKTLCPFHQEKSPSFMVNAEKQIYHCFGCGAGGNVFTFLMKSDGMEFPEVVERLAEKFGVPLAIGRDAGERRLKRSEKEVYYRLNRMAARHFFENLQDPEAGRKGRGYLEKRGILKEAAREALLGYALPSGKGLLGLLRERGILLAKAEEVGLIRKGTSDYIDFFRDRLIFPIVFQDGKIIGFSGRGLEPQTEPKYLNSQDSLIYQKGESFLGLNLAKDSIRESDQVVLVEGNFDQLRLYQEGVRNVVAPLGTALTPGQVRLLSRFTSNFVLIPDGDTAGQAASVRSLGAFLPANLYPKVVLLPQGEDPDSFVLREGIEEMRKRISTSLPLLDLVLERAFEEGGVGEVGKGRGVKEASEILAQIGGQIEKSLYIQKVAQIAGVEPRLVEQEVLKKMKKGRNFSPSPPEDVQRRPVVEQTLVEILVSGLVPPGDLFDQVRGEDFSWPPLREIWERLRVDYERHREVEVARILSEGLSPDADRCLTELAIGAVRWEREEKDVALQCVKRFRLGRYREVLRGISREIRDAERAHDTPKVKDLLERKRGVLKEMTTVH